MELLRLWYEEHVAELRVELGESEREKLLGSVDEAAHGRHHAQVWCALRMACFWRCSPGCHVSCDRRVTHVTHVALC
eukprot:365265-Chlamydomonas_euryale.AAC.10